MPSDLRHSGFISLPTISIGMQTCAMHEPTVLTPEREHIGAVSMLREFMSVPIPQTSIMHFFRFYLISFNNCFAIFFSYFFGKSAKSLKILESFIV